MSMQLSPQAAALLGKSDLVSMTERVDDVAFLIGQMVTRGLPEVLDRPIPRPWTPRGRSWGWTAVMWLASIVTEGAHRNVSVATSLKGRHHTLSHLTAQVIEPLALRDDRLSPLLQHVSKPASWHARERALHERSMAIDDLSQDALRCDATPVSGDHKVTEEGLGPCGQRKDDPTRPQITVMMGSLDPLGMPLATDVLSGERAEAGLDIPSMARLRTGWKTTGLLFGGAWQMRAWATRASLARHQAFSLSPLPLPGATAEAMDAWLTEGVTQGEAGEWARRVRTNDRGHEVLGAAGSAFERTCGAPGGEAAGSARVVVVRSPRHAHHQAAGLDTRLSQAETTLAALTPPRGRGKRQSTAEAPRLAAIALVLTAHRVDGWLRVTWAKPVEQKTQDVGRGRGSLRRAKRVLQPTRSHRTHIARQEDQIAELSQRFGWKALVTKAGQKRRSLQEAVLCSRNAYRVERLFNRLKSRVHIAPLCVKLNDHIEGLTSLLTLGVRVWTVTECVLRRSREKDQARLLGLPPENKHKMTDKPTAARILQAFSDVSLPSITHAAGEEILRRLTPLAGLQEDILQRLGLGASLYEQLEIQEMGGWLGEWGG